MIGAGQWGRALWEGQFSGQVSGIHRHVEHCLLGGVEQDKRSGQTIDKNKGWHDRFNKGRSHSRPRCASLEGSLSPVSTQNSFLDLQITATL